MPLGFKLNICYVHIMKFWLLGISTIYAHEDCLGVIDITMSSSTFRTLNKRKVIQPILFSQNQFRFVLFMQYSLRCRNILISIEPTKCYQNHEDQNHISKNYFYFYFTFYFVCYRRQYRTTIRIILEFVYNIFLKCLHRLIFIRYD